MTGFRRVALICIAVSTLVAEVPAAEIALVPVGATGSHTFVGNEIVLQGGGQRVFLELQISGWDPGMIGSPQLRGFQAVIDSSGYSSGTLGTLTPVLQSCITDDECTVAFGGACSLTGTVCTQTADCPLPQFGEVCGGGSCTFPQNVGGFCLPASILSKRSDYVFFNVAGGDLPITDLTSLNYRFASATSNTAVADPGGVLYAASLALDVPVGANGTFTIPLKGLPNTLLQDANSQFITPLTITAASIQVNCITAADCDDSSDCTNDSCSLGACSNVPNFNTATQCCNPIGGILRTINDGNVCTDDVCNASTGGVTHNPVPNGTACDDGAFCTVGESCVAGVCGSAAPRDCSDGVGCTDDTCNESLNRCQSTANNANCDDAVFCNGVETCSATLDCRPGTPPTCSDGVGCTIDSCDPVADACAHAPDDTACDDGLFCNGSETCSATQDCQAGTDPCPGQFCDDGLNICVNCLVDADCDNGLFCDGAETCVGGNCQVPTPVDCNDNVGCTNDSCDEAFNTCRNVPNDALCDDAVFCNGSETCSVTLDCQPGTTPTCDDGVGCTTDSCNAATDLCSNVPDDTACNDGLFCNGDETCSATQDCLAGTDPCPGQFCDDGPNICVNCLVDADCDNGLFCDGAETCVGGNCQVPTPVDCNDNVGCTNDSCDEAFNTCRNVPNDALCDDSVFCNGSETCSVTLDCQPGTTPTCDDGVGCTSDSCNTVTDLCSNLPDDTACDDGLFCNGGETCSATQDCQAGTDPCTGQFCDDGLNICVNCLIDAHCDDGLFCNGSETCVGGNCQAGVPVDCSEGIACTDDVCNETTDACDHFPNDALCPDDGLFCNGVEFCNATLDCDHRSLPCTGPCDEDLNLCSCIAPVLARSGSRYLRVIPQSMTGAPMRLVVTPVCAAGAVSRCVGPPEAIDLDVDGAVDETVASLQALGGNCPFLTPAEWGELYVADTMITPGSDYMVQADCGAPGAPSLSDGAFERTDIFGDTAGVFDANIPGWTPPNGSVDVFDLLAVLARFSNKFAAPPIYWVDVLGLGNEGFTCAPDHEGSVIPDVLVVIDGFEGESYALSTGCPNACP